MLKIKHIDYKGFEEVIEATDPSCGLHCFIVIHNTQLGPSLGGTRIYPYDKREAALEDALRLARAMTYKSSLAQVGLGGGKSVIISDPEKKSQKLLLAFAEVVNFLKGKYIAAEDIGSTVEDMLVLHSKTPFVAALPLKTSSGDPSPFTAWGIFRGLEAVAEVVWKNRSLRGKKIAIQGLGNVGGKLADLLFWQGAELILCDLDKDKAIRYSQRYGAKCVDPKQFCQVECDILAPCAMGGVINEKTVRQLRCQVVAGSANNQLASSDLGKVLSDKGILYAPDYVINSGGIINAVAEFDEEGYSPKRARDKVDNLYNILIAILSKALKEGRPTNEVADEIAEFNLMHGIGKRKSSISFKKNGYTQIT